MELSVMDRINMILSDPEKAPMTLAQIVSEEIREFKASEQYKIILEAESYYRNRSSVQKKTVDVANRSNAKIERPILKKLVDQKANYLLAKPWTVDTENGDYGDALNEVFDQTFRRKIKSLGKGAVKSGIAWLQPYFGDDGKLAFMRVPSTEVVPLWRDSERTKLGAFIRFYDQIVYIGTRKHTITHAEFWWTGGVRYFKTDAFAGTGAGDFIVDKEHGTEESDWTEPHFVVNGKPYNWEEVPIAWLKYNEAYLRGVALTGKLFQEYDAAAKAIRKEIADFYAKYAGKHGLTYDQAVRLLTRSEFREWKATLAEYIARIASEPDPHVKALLTAQLDALSTNSRISRLEALLGQIDMKLNDLFDQGVSQMKAEFGDAFQEGYYKKVYGKN